MLIELLSECNLLQKNFATMNSQDMLKRSSSPEGSSSISEFLEQERLCKEICSTIASNGVAAAANSTSGKEISRCDSALNISDLSDDDIGSILEKMSQIMSPSKSSQGSGSMNNSMFDSKQDRNIEDILQEAEMLMQESVLLQPPSVVNQNLLLEPSSISPAQSLERLTSASLSYQSINSAHNVGKNVSSHFLEKKTEDILSNTDRLFEVNVRGSSYKDETKDVSSSHFTITCDQQSDVSGKRKSHNLIKAKDLHGSMRQGTNSTTDLNRTFVVEKESSHRSILSQVNSRSSPSKGNQSLIAQTKKSQEGNEITGRIERMKNSKELLAQINSQIDSEVDSEEKCYREYLSKGAAKTGRENVLSNEHQESLAKKTEEIYAKINEEIRVEIEQVLKSKATKLEGLGTPIETPTLNGDFPNLKLSYPGLETPAGDVPGCFNLEEEFLEERKRCLKLKADLEWVGRLHAEEVTQLQKQHNEEMFALKKEIVLLTAKLAENIPSAPPVNTSKESERHKVEMLEKEMAEQEVLLAGYQRENELLCAELRSVKKLLKKLMSLLRKET